MDILSSPNAFNAIQNIFRFIYELQLIVPVLSKKLLRDHLNTKSDGEVVLGSDWENVILFQNDYYCTITGIT